MISGFFKKSVLTPMYALPLPVESARLVIRPFTKADVPQLALFFLDLHDDVLPMQFALVEAQSYLDDMRDPTGQHQSLGLFGKKDGDLKGRFSAYASQDSLADWEISYHLVHNARGNGYMREALNALKPVFQATGAMGLTACVAPANEKSLAVIEHAGFQESGPADKMYRFFRFKF